VGKNDDVVLLEPSMRYADALKKRGVDVKVTIASSHRSATILSYSSSLKKVGKTISTLAPRGEVRRAMTLRRLGPENILNECGRLDA
jgi:hypothetical protein